MYALIKTGGKQYRIEKGAKLRIEVPKEIKKEGDKIQLKDILLIADKEEIKIGSPFIENAEVTATIKSFGRGKKIEIIKFRRRTNNSRTKKGHRQNYCEIEINSIKV